MVVEFEFGHRNTDKLREVGHTVLSNEYGSLFIGIKIWKKTQKGTFGALLVVWEKNHNTGVVTVGEAFDFGTKELDTVTKTAWSKAGMTANMLPPTTVNLWQRPTPVAPRPSTRPGQPKLPTPAGWSLVIPKKFVLYGMPDTDTVAAQYLTSPAFHLRDLIIDLKVYQGQIDSILK